MKPNAIGRASESVRPRAVTHWRDIKGLWVNQEAALNMLSRYLDSGERGSALVRMPTGTGKTIVMAILAQMTEQAGTVLVVAPWAQLVGQLRREIGISVWTKLRAMPAKGLRTTLPFRPSTLSHAFTVLGGHPGVLVCTNNTLQRIHAADPDQYGALREQVSLVLVDEGHREPAPDWARAVRELERPTVLFTATPYRNDRRLFHVSDSYRYRFSFHEAVKRRLIRDVRILELGWDRDARSFCKRLVAFVGGRFRTLRPRDCNEPRVIVRCERSSEVREIAQHLRNLGQSVVAVHERFQSSDDASLRRNVPEPEETAAKYWVHQYKLVEGLDDHRFALLAMYQPFPDTRALVQQIGRITRNPDHVRGATATVLCFAQDRQEARWSRYLEFERSGSHGAEAGDILRAAMDRSKKLQYLDRDFRVPFDDRATDCLKHLLFRQSVNVFRGAPGLDIDKLQASVTDALEDEDFAILQRLRPDDDTRVVLYGVAETSPWVYDQIFMEVRLGHSIVHATPTGYIVHSDTEGVLPENFAKSMDRVAPTELERAFQLNGLRIGQVTLLNSDLGASSVRRRTLGARSVGDSAPGLLDHAHFCAAAIGSFKSEEGARVRRYVGFTRSRVSEDVEERVDSEAFCQWADRLGDELASRRRSPALFDRYAEFVARPRDRTPMHILIDLEAFEVLADLSSDKARSWPVELEELAAEVQNGVFRVAIGGKKAVPCRITWDTKRRGYQLESEALEQFGLRGLRERVVSLPEYLNREQAFRLITATGEAYYGGRYYKPRVPLWGTQRGRRIELLNTLIPSELLGGIESEKGDKGSATARGWSKSSLFGFVDDDTLWRQLSDLEPEIVVCDDLGNEVADFIALRRSPPWLALVHAKCAREPSEVSAGALHEISAQATKNLAVINPAQDSPLKSGRFWDEPWRGGSTGTVQSRIRRAPAGMKGTEIMAVIQSLARNPSATRNVVVLAAKTLSKRAFAEALESDKPAPQVVQSAYLLHSLWNVTSQLGAVLRVVCDV